MNSITTHSLRIVFMVILMAPFVLWGQNRGSVSENQQHNDLFVELEKSFAKLTSQDAKECLNRLSVMYRYQDSVAKIEKLKEAKKVQNTELGKLQKQQNDAYQIMSMLQQKGVDQMYAQYDTCMLLRQKGHYGSEAMEAMMEDLLACKRAEKVLACRYEQKRVNDARLKLKSVKSKDVAVIANNLDERLEHYGDMTNNLRSLLTSINAKEKPKTDDSDYKKDEYMNQVFDLVEKGIVEKRLTKVLESNSFPYLYDRLMEALELKKSDYSSNLDEIIKKL